MDGRAAAAAARGGEDDAPRTLRIADLLPQMALAPKDLVNIAWAYVTLGVRHPQLFVALARAAVKQVGTREGF